MGNNKNPRIIFNCFYCHKQASDRPSHYSRKKRHYCSRKCYANDRENNWKPSEQNTWKGGIAKINQTGRGGRKYRIWMDSVMSIFKYKCFVCRDIAYHAHHIKGWTEFPELRYEISNGVALCEDCHYEIHYENPELLTN